VDPQYQANTSKFVQADLWQPKWTRKDVEGRTNHFTYSYNWPYDFFSLVELAKIDSITTFNPNYGSAELDNLIKEDDE